MRVNPDQRVQIAKSATELGMGAVADLCRDVEELEKENQRLQRIMSEPEYAKIEIGKGFAEAEFKHWAVSLVVLACREHLEAGPGNHAVMEVNDGKTGQRYIVTIQKAGAKTVDERVLELSKENAELKEQLAKPAVTESDHCEEERRRLEAENTQLRSALEEYKAALGDKTTTLMKGCDLYEKERQKAEAELKRIRDWYGERWARLQSLMKEYTEQTGYNSAKDMYGIACNIIANGKPDSMDQSRWYSQEHVDGLSKTASDNIQSLRDRIEHLESQLATKIQTELRLSQNLNKEVARARAAESLAESRLRLLNENCSAEAYANFNALRRAVAKARNRLRRFYGLEHSVIRYLDAVIAQTEPEPKRDEG